MKVHLVDATYELFRAFFGAPPAKSPDGVSIGAVRGLCLSMASLLRGGATHVGCATDHVIESFRNDLYAGYKTGEGLPAELTTQFPIVEDGMRAMGLVVWPMVEFEADDALATAAARCAADARVEQVVIASPDKDLAQCVSGERVIMLDRMRQKTMDEAGVVAKFGVPPRAIADYLALVGDAADGYPGIKGFGARTAAAVLGAFGRIEDIPADARAWPKGVRGADRLAATLAGARDEALLYKKLATLRTDAPLRETTDDLAWRGPSPDLAAFCERWGLGELPGRVAAVGRAPA